MGRRHDRRHDDFRVELFVFPDGTSVEMMVFDGRGEGGSAIERRAITRAPEPQTDAAPPSQPPAPADTAGAARSPSPSGSTATGVQARVCPVCGGGLVYPLDWEREDASTWTLRLRCPECETVRDVVMDRPAVEALNRELYLAHREVAEASRDMARRHFEEEAERIIAALRSGLIQPMDF